MIVESRHGTFEKVSDLHRYVIVRCRDCNLMYTVNAMPADLDREFEPRYLGAQLPKYCPCRFVASTDVKIVSPQRDINDEKRRLHHGEGLEVIDLTGPEE